MLSVCVPVCMRVCVTWRIDIYFWDLSNIEEGYRKMIYF